MNINVENIVLDVNRDNMHCFIYAKQEDDLSRKINITLTENGKKITPAAGSTAVFRAVKPDGTNILNPAVINTDGTISITLTEQVIAVSGTVLADVYITTGTDVLSSGNFRIEVERLPFSGIYGSYNEFKLFEEALNEMKENGGVNFMTEAVASKQNKVLYGTTEPAESLGENGDIYVMTGTAQDYIVEQVLPASGGSIGYRKWNSGYCEIFGYTSITTAVSTAWGQCFYSPKQTINLPIQPKFVYQAQIAAEHGEVWVMSKTLGRTAEEFYLVSAKSQASATAYLHVYITGKWK